MPTSWPEFRMVAGRLEEHLNVSRYSRYASREVLANGVSGCGDVIDETLISH